jgi:uncharacterized membrane protein YhdT
MNRMTSREASWKLGLATGKLENWIKTAHLFTEGNFSEPWWQEIQEIHLLLMDCRNYFLQPELDEDPVHFPST